MRGITKPIAVALFRSQRAVASSYNDTVLNADSAQRTALIELAMVWTASANDDLVTEGRALLACLISHGAFVAEAA